MIHFNKYITQVLFLLLGLLSLAACTDEFDEVNTDPNVVTEVPADYYLPGSVKAIADMLNTNYESLSCSDNWVQHIAFNGAWAAPQYYSLDRFRISLFTDMYAGPLMDLEMLCQTAQEEGNQGLYAVGLTLRSFGFQLVTDVFGDVPYTESLLLTSGQSNPAYDEQQVIYHALIDSLDRANTIFSNVDALTIEEGYDVMYDGSLSKWRRLANSLRVRMLMRISAKEDVSEELQAMLDNPDDYPLYESNDHTATYTYGGNGLGDDYPLALLFEEGSADQGVYISETLVNQLVATTDPRLERFALPNSDEDYQGCSHFVAYNNVEEGFFSRIHTDLGAADRTVEFYEYSELQFLLAEAAEKGFISQDAETFYNNGVTASCLKFGVSASDAEDYLDNGGAYSGDLEQIYMEKWVALFMQGFEAWAEYRRTGYPELDLVLYAELDQIPDRFFYPNVELETNAANLNEAADRMEDGDRLTSSVWWMNN